MKKKYVVKRRWVIILAIMAIILLVGGTLAIYTSQVYQRAVVRNRYNEVIRFSSDKLYRVMDGTDPQKYYYPMDQGQTTMTFSVCNYDQANNTLFNEKTINYSITFKVINGSTDGFEYIISCGNQEKARVQNGKSVSIDNNILPGGKKSVDTYTVTFAEGDYDKVEIEVVVTPMDLTTTQSRILNGILIPIKYATTQGVRLSQGFIDSTRDMPDKFDAYNLLVSVSGGEGDVVISWDANALDIDPFFVTESSGTRGTAENGYTTLTVPMNSEDATGTYLITFYNHNNTEPGWTAWTDLPIMVNLKEPTSEPTAP